MQKTVKQLIQEAELEFMVDFPQENKENKICLMGFKMGLVETFIMLGYPTFDTPVSMYSPALDIEAIADKFSI